MVLDVLLNNVETRRYKVHGAVGGSRWETGSTLALLDSMPSMTSILRFLRVVPPLHVLNEILASGTDEAGMSGGCEWKSFEIHPDEYAELVEEWMTSPHYQCVQDVELAKLQGDAAWRKAVSKKYMKLARDRDLE